MLCSKQAITFFIPMRIIKKIIRSIVMIFILVLASVGLGMGPLFGHRQDRYLDTEIKTEQVEKREDESDLEMKDVG